jgi:hypothetical protein
MPPPVTGSQLGSLEGAPEPSGAMPIVGVPDVDVAHTE